MRCIQSIGLALCIVRAAHAQSAPVPQNEPNQTASFQIRWNSCSGSTSTSPTNTECGKLEVPIDWSQSNSAQTTLGLMRVKAANSSTRRGSLLFNPGGPGVAATTLCQAASIA